jgi:hypothetical protein
MLDFALVLDLQLELLSGITLDERRLEVEVVHLKLEFILPLGVLEAVVVKG